MAAHVLNIVVVVLTVVLTVIVVFIKVKLLQYLLLLGSKRIDLSIA